MPGYDLEINGEYARLESLLCPSCNLILRDAIQTEEGVRLCKTCCDRILSSPNATCPLSRITLDPNDPIHTDRAVRKEVDKLLVKCQDHKHGCPWTGSLKEHEQNHRSNCEYRIKSCPKGCGVEIRLTELKIHLEQCQLRLITCPHCHVPLVAKEYRNHQFTCTVIPIFCKWCNIIVNRSEIDKHISLECNVMVEYAGIIGHIQQIPEGNCALLSVNYIGHFETIQLIEKKIASMKEELVHIQTEVKQGDENYIGRLMEIIEGLQLQTKNLATKVAEQERLPEMFKVHISELELQLQASLASTYNGSFLWRIPDIRRRRRDAIDGKITSIYSPPFYTGRNGYKMCIRAYLNGDGIGTNTHVSIFFVLMKGEYDPLLKWPFDYKVSLITVDQDHRRHIVQTFKPSPSINSDMYISANEVRMNITAGFPKFADKSVLDDSSYIKDDVMYIKCIVHTGSFKKPVATVKPFR